MYLDKDQEKLMNEAFAYCDKTFEDLLKRFKKSKDIQNLLIRNTFFAGGVFRSSFTKTPVSDIDIYFKNTESIATFLDFVFSSGLAPYKMVETKRGTLNFTDNPCSLITSVYGKPTKVLESFDFTFNSHFYDAWTGDFSINTAVFKKQGHILQGKNSVQTSAGCLNRAFRFLNEGFKIDREDLTRLVQRVVNEEKFNGSNSIREAIQQGTSSSDADSELTTGLSRSYVETFQTMQENSSPQPTSPRVSIPNSMWGEVREAQPNRPTRGQFQRTPPRPAYNLIVADDPTPAPLSSQYGSTGTSAYMGAHMNVQNQREREALYARQLLHRTGRMSQTDLGILEELGLTQLATTLETNNPPTENN